MKATRIKAALAEELQARSGLFRFSMEQFLVVLILLLVTFPFVIDLKHGLVIEDALMGVNLISAVLAVGGRKWVLTILLVIPALVGPWMEHFWHGAVPSWIISCAHMIFVGFVISQLLRFILQSTRVNSDVMCAGIAAYLMLGLLWSAVYLMISELNPASFFQARLAGNQPLDRFDALYLSYASLTCLGCGDITPQSKIARMLLMVEATTGVLYMAVLIARLVALYSRQPEKNSKP
jgi:hypothetical protein